ncbi:MAG: SMC-Scp complex subunit ScpB [Gemmatimonadota bacterium]
MNTTQIIEALLFASDAPLSAEDLARGEEELDVGGVEAAIDALRAEYDARGRAFQVYRIAGGYQLLTRPEYSPHLERFETVPTSARLSGAALEVLAIIAYRQPIGRSEIEEIRGVGSSHVLRSLQEVGLIEVVGRGEGLGRPLLYGTTPRFLEHFGFGSLDELPRPDELPVVLTERAEAGRTDTSESESASEAESEPESASESDAEPEPETESESEPDGEPDAEPDAGREPS